VLIYSNPSFNIVLIFNMVGIQLMNGVAVASLAANLSKKNR
jgi:hypothetical protein